LGDAGVYPFSITDRRSSVTLHAFHTPQWNNSAMIIGDRLRGLREEKKLSQGDIEKRTGLLRCYISRVETVIQQVADFMRKYMAEMCRRKSPAFSQSLNRS
jgi:hypothetical protein